MITGENVIWNNDQNVFLSSRDCEGDGSQRNIDNLRIHGNCLANYVECEKNGKIDSHSNNENKFSNNDDNDYLELVDSNNQGTKAERNIFEREIVGPIIERRNETDEEETENKDSESDNNKKILCNKVNENFDKYKVENTNGIYTKETLNPNESIQSYKKEGIISNGIPKILINQCSSESKEKLNSKIDNTPQNMENGNIDDNGWIVNDNQTNYTPSISNLCENSSSEKNLLSNNDEIDENVNSEKFRKYRHGSIGKNGWITSSDESESETEAANLTTLPLDDANDDDKEMFNNEKEDGANSLQLNDEERKTLPNEIDKEEINCKRNGNESEMKNLYSIPDNEKKDATERDVSVPMQMVTTVLCIFVLCCSVLINLFL